MTGTRTATAAAAVAEPQHPGSGSGMGGGRGVGGDRPSAVPVLSDRQPARQVISRIADTAVAYPAGPSPAITAVATRETSDL